MSTETPARRDEPELWSVVRREPEPNMIPPPFAGWIVGRNGMRIAIANCELAEVVVAAANRSPERTLPSPTDEQIVQTFFGEEFCDVAPFRRRCAAIRKLFSPASPHQNHDQPEPSVREHIGAMLERLEASPENAAPQEDRCAALLRSGPIPSRAQGYLERRCNEKRDHHIHQECESDECTTPYHHAFVPPSPPTGSPSAKPPAAAAQGARNERLQKALEAMEAAGPANYDTHPYAKAITATIDAIKALAEEA